MEYLLPGTKETGKLLQGGASSFISAPPPSPVAASLTGTPDLKAAEDRVRQERDARDALNRRRGRRSTIATGPEGVGDTPLGIKSLIGT